MSNIQTSQQVIIDRGGFNQLCHLVLKMAGIVITEDQIDLVRSRLGKRICALGKNTLTEYLDYILKEETQKELDMMLDALTTNLTCFWRCPGHFDYLSSALLPIIEQHRLNAKVPKIRIWCAGCSTGQEPYSIAMLFLKLLNGSQEHNLEILATDLSARVLEIAKTGLYSEEQVENIPDRIGQKYFQLETNNGQKLYRIAPEIKSIVKFVRINLIENWPMNNLFDFIFCRNVLMYFDNETRYKLVQKFYKHVQPHGLFFISDTETLSEINHAFRYIAPGIYKKS